MHIVIVTTSEGAPLAVRCANHEAAERFAAKCARDDHGILPLVSQSEAVLQGAME